MALSDYILCAHCDSKTIYEGGEDIKVADTVLAFCDLTCATAYVAAHPATPTRSTPDDE